MSHTSLDELWAVEETDERANSLVDLNGGSDVMGVLSERDSEGDTDNNSPTVPAWFTPSSPQPAGSVTITQDEISNLTTRGSSLTSASPRRTESLREDAMSRGDAGVAGAMVGGMAGGSSQGSTAPATPAAREAECVGHTGIPLLDEEPGLVREVQDMREQVRATHVCLVCVQVDTNWHICLPCAHLQTYVTATMASASMRLCHKARSTEYK